MAEGLLQFERMQRRYIQETLAKIGGISMSFPSQFVNKIQKIVHHQGASNIVVFIFDVSRLLQPVSSRNYALLQLPVIVLSILNNTPKSEIFKLHSRMFSINEGLSVYRSCVLRWWGSEKQIMITVVKKWNAYVG